MVNIIKQIIKLFNKIFPVKVTSFTDDGKLLKHRDIFYIFRIANVMISNIIGKIKRVIKSFLPEYGYVSFVLIITLILLLSLIFKENFIGITIEKIFSIHKITSWISDFATISVFLLALHPIHHKSKIGISKFSDSHNLAIQVLNRSNNSSFIKLHHIYICNKNRSQILASSGFDFSKYYSKYTKWMSLPSYKRYTFWIINGNNNSYLKHFRCMYKEYFAWISLLKNPKMHYIVFEFSINDHHFDIASKAIDINVLNRNFGN